MIAPERQVRRTFVELADTLVADYDIIAFLDSLAHRVVSLLDVAACGLVVADHHDTLNLIAATTEDTRMLELMQLQNSEGPCFECYHSGVPVHDGDLAKAAGRWPRFAPAARGRGFRSVYALPMRLRDSVIGAMNLFRTTSQPLESGRLELGQALADVATIGITHARAVSHYEVVTEQLQSALNSRIVIEQAKGILVERLGVSIEEAFGLLRQHARSNNNKLAETAHAVIEGKLLFSQPPQQ